MVTIKHAIRKPELNTNKELDELLPDILYGYRTRRGFSGHSLFEVSYGKMAHMSALEQKWPSINTLRYSELLVAENWTAEKATKKQSNRKDLKTTTF